MAQECCKSNPFVKSFIPGLVLGIIVGGLAGAVLPTFIEKWSQPTIVSNPGGAVGVKTGERDARPQPVQPAADVKPEEKPAETKPEEAKPADPKPGEPVPTPKNN